MVNWLVRAKRFCFYFRIQYSTVEILSDAHTKPAFTCSKLTIETLEALVNFEHVNAGWVSSFFEWLIIVL